MTRPSHQDCERALPSLVAECIKGLGLRFSLTMSVRSAGNQEFGTQGFSRSTHMSPCRGS